MTKIVIDHDKCGGSECGECVDVCPTEILVLEGDKVVVKDVEECSLCEVCMDLCPEECIVLKDE